MSHQSTSNDDTVPMKFTCAVGNFTPSGRAYTYEFNERAPRALCTLPAYRKCDPDPDATGVFMTSLIDRYSPEILAARAWHCEICGRPAKELAHSAIPMLSPGPYVQPGFEPMIWNTVVPICRSAGECDVAAYNMAHAFARMNFPNPIIDGRCCDYCGKVSHFRFCSGCKVLGYCSKECQSKSWPYHRKNCTKTQKQRGERGMENIFPHEVVT